MRLPTVLAALALCGALVGAILVGLAGGGGALAQTWISDTARQNEVNHHAVGVGPSDEVVVAPVAAVPNAEPIGPESCSLVRLDPAAGATEWRWSVPPEDCFTHALTQPAIADLDDDGSPEVAASTTQNALVVLDAASGNEEWRVPLSTYGYGQPAVSTADDGPAVVTSDIQGTVVAAHGNGTVAWRTDLNTTVWARPRLVDLDADGAPEVVVGGKDGVVALDTDGTELWRSPTPATTLAAVERDGGPTVFAGDLQQLTGLDGTTGQRLWERSVSGTARLHATGDADADGDAEVYVGHAPNTVLAVDATTGDVEWETPLGGGERQSMFAPVLADVDGDGTEDVVAVTNGGTVVVLDGRTGGERAAYERDVLIWTFATPADLDGDGDADVLARYGDGRVVALDWVPGSQRLVALG